MALTLYRRHRKECEGKHLEDSRSGEFEEGRRGWGKKCACLIHVSGTLGGKFNRKQTGKSSWDEAKVVASAWEAAQSWSTVAVAPVPSAPAEFRSDRVAISTATAAFLANREGAQIAPATLRKYRTFVRQLTAFAETQGYVMLDQFSAADIDVFYGTMKLGARAKGKWLGTLRAFFRFCMHRKWLQENPVTADLKPPLGANRVANKVPFTDDELERIVKACDVLGEVTWKSGDRAGVWTGEDAKDFIWVLAYTGLRISDVALFDVKRLRGNDIFLRAKKNGGDVFAYIPDWLRARLEARAARFGHMPFLVGESTRLETVTDTWRRKLNKVFDLAGQFEETPTPHRFRHTFARILLERGVPVADVADLLGDDEDTVRQHYSRWVPERQARLTNILRGAFEGRVSVSGG